MGSHAVSFLHSVASLIFVLRSNTSWSPNHCRTSQSQVITWICTGAERGPLPRSWENTFLLFSMNKSLSQKSLNYAPIRVSKSHGFFGLLPAWLRKWARISLFNICVERKRNEKWLTNLFITAPKLFFCLLLLCHLQERLPVSSTFGDLKKSRMNVYYWHGHGHAED